WSNRQHLINLVDHLLDSRSIIPKNAGQLANRSNDLDGLRVLLRRAAVQADINSVNEIHRGEFADDILHCVRGEIFEQSGDDDTDWKASGRMFQRLFHL